MMYCRKLFWCSFQVEWDLLFRTNTSFYIIYFIVELMPFLVLPPVPPLIAHVSYLKLCCLLHRCTVDVVSQVRPFLFFLTALMKPETLLWVKTCSCLWGGFRAGGILFMVLFLQLSGNGCIFVVECWIGTYFHFVLVNHLFKSRVCSVAGHTKELRWLQELFPVITNFIFSCEMLP